MQLGLTCKVHSDRHNDDDDPQNDEGNAEQSGQAAQSPGPIQVPLLHAASRLQRDGRDLRKTVRQPLRSVNGLQMGSQTCQVLTATHTPAGSSWRGGLHLLGGPLTRPGPH
jgi:hypothetical protein